MIIYFAHESLVWLELSRDSMSVLYEMPAESALLGAGVSTSKMAHSHGWQVWELSQREAGPQFLSIWASLQAVGLAHSMAASFWEQGLKKQQGSESCQLLKSGPGHRHSISFAFIYWSSHQGALILGEGPLTLLPNERHAKEFWGHVLNPTQQMV